MSQESQTSRPGPNPMSYLGLISAMAIMLGLPALSLTTGQSLSSGVQLTILILALALGGVIAITSTFFGIILPSARSNGFKYLCLLASLAVILGLPWLVLSRGNLPEWMQVVAIILAVIAGSVMALITVFFGLVIPHRGGGMGRLGRKFDNACWGVKVEATPTGKTAEKRAEGVRVENGDKHVRVDADAVDVQDGDDRVQVDDSGVRIQDGKQTIVIDEKGVRIEKAEKA